MSGRGVFLQTLFIPSSIIPENKQVFFPLTKLNDGKILVTVETVVSEPPASSLRT